MRFLGAATWNYFLLGGVCKMSAYDNLALCTYFGIDALKTKKKAYMYADVHLLKFYTYVCTYDSYILFFLWLNTYIDANQFYIWMYDYVHFFSKTRSWSIFAHVNASYVLNFFFLGILCSGDCVWTTFIYNWWHENIFFGGFLLNVCVWQLSFVHILRHFFF